MKTGGKRQEGSAIYRDLPYSLQSITSIYLCTYGRVFICSTFSHVPDTCLFLCLDITTIM